MSPQVMGFNFFIGFLFLIVLILVIFILYSLNQHGYLVKIIRIIGLFVFWLVIIAGIGVSIYALGTAIVSLFSISPSGLG
jgi:hypothetical protein